MTIVLIEFIRSFELAHSLRLREDWQLTGRTRKFPIGKQIYNFLWAPYECVCVCICNWHLIYVTSRNIFFNLFTKKFNDLTTRKHRSLEFKIRITIFVFVLKDPRLCSYIQKNKTHNSKLFLGHMEVSQENAGTAKACWRCDQGAQPN